jgi:protein-disulfide isomerase
MFHITSLFPARPRLERAGAAAVATLLLACGLEAQSAQAPADAGKHLATVDGKPITQAEVLENAAAQLENVEAQKLQCEIQADQSRHQVMDQAVRGLVRERLVEEAAAKASLGRDEWFQQELDRRQEAISEEEITEFFERNRNRMRNANRDQIGPQIRQYLATEALYAGLEEGRDIDYNLDPFRLEVAATGPSKGPETAPVTVVEFSDFQCPYCKQVVPTMEQALARYEGKLRLVFRQYPLTSIHPQAYKAAEASLCAADQGKFWELHDAMFADQAALDVPALEGKAKDLGLDVAAFSSCVSSGKYTEQVREDLKAGSAAGVTGTPAFFVNGRPLSGAIGLDRLSEIVDEELARAKSGS